jgi:hypothetical protein
MAENFCHCTDVDGLPEVTGTPNDSEEWHLSWRASPEVKKLFCCTTAIISLHSGCSICSFENRANIKKLLEQIYYEYYDWDVCGYFMMLGHCLKCTT